MTKSGRKYKCPECGKDVTDRVNEEIANIASGGSTAAAYDQDEEPADLPGTVEIQCEDGHWAIYTIR